VLDGRDQDIGVVDGTGVLGGCCYCHCGCMGGTKDWGKMFREGSVVEEACRLIHRCACSEETGLVIEVGDLEI
jgi:hypothetical protein